jgi:hypothetical protein
MKARSALILLFLSTAATLHVRGAAAQQEDLIRAGARIRLWSVLAKERFLTGRLLDLKEDAITVIPTGDTVLTLPLDSIRRLELSIGRNKGIVALSVAAGAALGALIVPALITDPAVCELGYENESACTTEVPYVILGAAVGTIGGLMVSAPLAPERWARIRIDLLLRDGTVRIERGVALSASLSF